MLKKENIKVATTRGRELTIEANGRISGLTEDDSSVQLIINVLRKIIWAFIPAKGSLIGLPVDNYTETKATISLPKKDGEKSWITVCIAESGNAFGYKVGIIRHFGEFFVTNWNKWHCGMVNTRIDNGIEFPLLVKELEPRMRNYARDTKYPFKAMIENVSEGYQKPKMEYRGVMVHWNSEMNQGAALTKHGYCLVEDPEFGPDEKPFFVPGETVVFVDFAKFGRDTSVYVGKISGVKPFSKEAINHSVNTPRVMDGNAALLALKQQFTAKERQKKAS